MTKAGVNVPKSCCPEHLKCFAKLPLLVPVQEAQKDCGNERHEGNPKHAHSHSRFAMTKEDWTIVFVVALIAIVALSPRIIEWL